MNNKQLIGSRTAKGGFENESDITTKFNDYKIDSNAKEWLNTMGYNPENITSLIAKKIPPRINREVAIMLGAKEELIIETIKFKKADIQIRVELVIDEIHYIENISLKKADNNIGYNQIDKRPVRTYKEMWSFNDNIEKTLKLYTGEILPPKTAKNIKDKERRRMFLNELPENDVDLLLQFLKKNRILIVNDVIRGRGALSADWVLVTRKNTLTEVTDWVLHDVNFVCNFYGGGEIYVNNNGNLKFGKITIQRKGGTPDPTSLQFKLNPLELFI